MRKSIALILILALVATVFAGCTGAAEPASTQPAAEAPSAAEAQPAAPATEERVPLKVGMLCDGVIDDRAFNQTTWEGIQEACKNLGLECQYILATDSTDEDYLNAMQNLIDAGFNMIVTPGFTFASVVHTAQSRWPEVKFVILDSAPQAADADKEEITPNTVAIDFQSNESGFLAGFASALQLKEGKFGGVHGMEIPPTKLFVTGFEQGVIYANENYGTNVRLNDDDFIYVGSFTDNALGQQAAAQLFDKGCNLVYIAGGPGALNEVKARGEAGQEVWCVMCDTDRYEDGMLSNGKSVVMTSTLKCLNAAIIEVIRAYTEDGEYEGGQKVVFSVKDDGVGIPATNPNLSDEVQSTVNEIYEKIKTGELAISAEATDCTAWGW